MDEGQTNMLFGEADTEYIEVANILRECDELEWKRHLNNFQRQKVNDKRLPFILKKRDELQWKKHLNNFQTQMVNDKRLQFILNNDDNEVWKELIPEIGIRFQFKALWKDKQLSVQKHID